jgi:hypothetical protein
MKITKIIWAALSCLIFLSTLVHAAEESTPQKEQSNIPWYFVTVDNEAFNNQQHQFYIEESYTILKKIVAKADEYHIKLTLLFAPPWADYLLADKERAAELAQWKKNGHEIGAYHHEIDQENWDGYSLLPQSEAEMQRIKMGYSPASSSYHGSLTDFITKLRQLNPDLKSGCMNDEHGKDALTDTIVYDTCSGFANFGELGHVESDTDPEKGRNDYLTVGSHNNIERKWLTHYVMTSEEAAENVFNAMPAGGVYGVVNQSVPRDLQAVLDYLEFLHTTDPQAKMSRTVSQIIEQKLLPEKKLSNAQVHTLIPPAAHGKSPKGSSENS